MNESFEETNKNEYLTLVPTNESKEKNLKIEELWSKIRDLIRPITKNSDDYDEKHMKLKFDLDDALLLNNTLEIHIAATIVRAIFYEINKSFLKGMSA